ncbi:MAG: hypothetical protein JWN13_1490 [Betaproteobacteria bacterium]|jgi:hypothetical protein|nr:hypothetical protein [Betaproteobacteria bacterium]MEA3155029.1 hypothetical protein [Betaproteobacteria bacterium]
MISEYEARKLQRDLRSELNATPAAVWRCAAGLLVLVVLTLVGIEFGLQPDSESTRTRLGIGKPATALGEVTDQDAQHLERVTKRD